MEMEWGGVWLNWRFEITGDVKRARGSLKGREMVGGWWVEWREEIIGNVCYVMRSLFG